MKIVYDLRLTDSRRLLFTWAINNEIKLLFRRGALLYSISVVYKKNMK